MPQPKLTTAYKKDLLLVHVRGYDIENDLFPLLTLLLEDRPLPRRCRDHPLKGRWHGYREFHVTPDWIVIYRKTKDFLVLARTGTHSDLFSR